VQTQLEEVAENKVRLTVDVDRHDVEHAVEHAASDLAGQVKIPGFRKGKVPMPVLIQRVGKERLYSEAIESHIGGWFWSAAARERIRPVGQPEYDFQLPASDKEGWRFIATVDVQPKPTLPDWKTLEVPRPDAEVPEELVQQELGVLRSSVADLAPVDHRPAQPGDVVMLDLVNPDGTAQRDYVVGVGSGRLVEEIEAAVIGMSVGESKSVEFELGDDARGTVEVVVKDIREQVLPPLDDELARTATEFDTFDELRAEIEERLGAQVAAEAEGAFRAAAIDALVDSSDVDARGPLVDARTRELLNGLVRSVERRGVNFDTYLALTGQRPEELVARLQAEAKRSVEREIVLEAAAERLGVEVSDAEVEAVVREQAGDDADDVLADLRGHGGFERLREDLKLRKALDRLAAEVTPISVDLAQARETIWTPEKEKPQTAAKLWTPGSKET
jgi:trigger factor